MIVLCSFPDKRFTRFCPWYVAPHIKTKMKKSEAGQVTIIDESKMCPLQAFYDGDIHDGLGNLRKLDGSIPFSERYGWSVNFFAPKGSRKYWTKTSTPELGYSIQ